LERHVWDTVVINCYAATEEGNNDIKCEFYEELERIYDTLPRNCINILLEDFMPKSDKSLYIDLL